MTVNGLIPSVPSVLFKPIKIGSLQLPNRIIMAPLTRCRANHGTLVPNKHAAEYYRQRASAGLLITEATSISPTSVGYWTAPGIWTDEQVEGWKGVTGAVHAAGGRIFCQIWHVGRSTDANEFGPFYEGKQSVSSSNKPINGNVHLLRPKRRYPTPRALETSEMPDIVAQFRHGAKCVEKAGFDGVHIHAANGYLIDQFLQDSVNQGRTDQYGGSVENRARLLLEIVDAVAEVLGADRVGVHISPRGDYNDVGDSDPTALFTYVACELGKRQVAFLSVRENQGPGALLGHLKEHFKGPVIGNEAMTATDAERLIEAGTMDAVAFGRYFLTNPDLVKRIELNAPLNAPDYATFYTWGPEGYTDYPTLEELEERGGPKEEMGNARNVQNAPLAAMVTLDG